MITVYFAVAVLSTWTLTDAVFDVSTGLSLTCAINEGQGVKCWGDNAYGQLGLGHTTDMYEPTDTVDLGTDFEPKEVGCGYYHCCSLSTAASIKCWGSNTYGQLGYGDVTRRGDDGGEMGDDLEVVQLPTNFTPDHLVVYAHGSCVVSNESQIVCFGRNGLGLCGVGHSSNIGDGANEMGDYLVALDLGGDFDLAQLGEGPHSSCAVSTVGAVKCWGWNGLGQLGLGDTNNRGDSSNEMGDFLPYVDLGTEFYATSANCGQGHCCAVSTDGELKCWGRNEYGQLGQEDTTQRGDNADEMGDHLVAVSMGADFSAAQVTCMKHGTCALSTSGDIKCFGVSNVGQLGYGDTTTRGSTAGSMGDALSVVDIGTGFTETGIRFATSCGYVLHVCVFEESTALLLKCWGYNNAGQLGYGDTNNRGDESDEMGNNLPFVDHGFQPICERGCLVL